MILRVGLCIPTFDNPLTIAQVVKDCLALGYPVVVVDDGSKIPVRTLLGDARVDVLRAETNEGKGAALQRAFRYGVSQGWTHLVSIDGDGQHHAHDAATLIAAASAHPWDLIIGQRRMTSASVPGVSKFGRKFSNFWVDYQTGRQVADSQSGYRLYPLFHVQNMRFLTQRYDFEIEVLIRLLWKGVHVREVECDVYYPSKEERVSHFDKFWDNVRISLLNTLFVILSLLKTHRSPREAALAFGAGVWIGCTPFFGLHTLIAAAVSFFFRLNGAFLLIGTQVSIPPVAPFLIGGSLAIGAALVGREITTVPHGFRDAITFAGEHFGIWLLGSLILGAALGAAIGLVVYFIARRLQAPKGNWSGRNRGGKFGNGFLKLLLRTCGLRAGYFALAFIVPYFYLFAPRGRSALNEYYRVSQPTLGFFARQARIMKHFYRFGQILMDRAVQVHVSQAEPGRVLFRTHRHGFENLIDALEADRGLLLLGAHVGGWDLSTALADRDERTSRLSVVKFQAAQSPEHAKGLATNSDQPIFDIHSLMSAKRPVGLMGDRPMSDRIELVPFFGKLAPFDITAFRLAAATRVPLMSAYAFKNSKGEYDFYAFPAQSFAYAPGDRAPQIYEWLKGYVERLEGLLRQYPDQWFNFYAFWSRVPAPTGEPSTAPPR